MINDDRLNTADKAGFVRKVGEPSLTKEQRTSLIRKGNEVFNKGDLAGAERIFATVKYGDGLIRLGDAYFKIGRVLDAFTMYKLAQANSKTDALSEKMAMIIRSWLENHGERQEQKS